jgi:dUTPase
MGELVGGGVLNVVNVVDPVIVEEEERVSVVVVVTVVPVVLEPVLITQSNKSKGFGISSAFSGNGGWYGFGTQ